MPVCIVSDSTAGGSAVESKSEAFLSSSSQPITITNSCTPTSHQTINYQSISNGLNGSIGSGSMRFRSNTTTGIVSSSINQNNKQHHFLHESINSSLDFPTYIPWHSLSSEVNEKLRNGSLRINNSNLVEWADPIKEGNEKQALLNQSRIDEEAGASDQDNRVSKATNPGISWQVASFLLVNCALGAGILNYPQAYDKVGGVLIATILQLVLMVVLGFTMLILVYSSDLNGDDTYHDVLLSMCGKRAQQLAAVSILLTCYGISVTFLIIIGDQIEKIFQALNIEHEWYSGRKQMIAFLSTFFILPMCYFKRLDFLKYAGALGVFSMLYVVFINIYEYFYMHCENVEVRTSPEDLRTLIAVIPVICFAYQCHEIVVPVYASMRHRNVRSFTKTTIMSLVILFVLYSLAGTSAYHTFGRKVTSDIMSLYDAKQPVVMLCTLALVIKMITTYPTMIFCGRGALDGLYGEFFNLTTEQFIAGERYRRMVITTSWFFTSLLLAIFTPNIGIVIELLGSLASANVFIFPSLCLISIARRNLADQSSKSYKYAIFTLSGALIVFGVAVFFLVVREIGTEILYGKPHDILRNVTYCVHTTH